LCTILISIDLHGGVFYSGIDGSLNLKVVSPTLLVAEKEEAKAVLTLFLKKQGLSNAIAARTSKKSDHFIDHLVSRLHSKHKSWYLAGLSQQLITLFHNFHPRWVLLITVSLT